jgi:hypothetical protein
MVVLFRESTGIPLCLAGTPALFSEGGLGLNVNLEIDYPI